MNRSTRNRVSRILALGVAAVALLASGCTNDNVINETGFEGAYALIPDLVQPVASSDPNYDYMFSFQIALIETGNQVGATIDIIEVFVEEAQGGVRQGTQPGDDWLLNTATLPVPLPAGGNLLINADLFFTLQSGADEAIVDVGILFTDDEGNQFSAFLSLDVVP